MFVGWLSSRCAVATIIVVYLVVASAYSFLVPLWEAPDEPSHFLYIRHIADTGRLPGKPSLGPEAFDPWHGSELVLSQYEWHHPPLYYLAASAAIKAMDWVGFRYDEEDFPAINPYFPVQESLFWPPEPSSTSEPSRDWEPHLLRLISVGLGAATLVALSRVASLAFPDEYWLPPTLVGFVAFIPQFTFTMASISNDPLAILLSTVSLVVLIRILIARGGSTVHLWALLLVTIAAALLTKANTLFLAPTALIVAAIRLFRYFPRFRALLYIVLLVTSVATLAAGCYFLVPGRIGLMARGTVDRLTFVRWGLLDPAFLYIYEVLVQTNKTFWAKFGWAGIETPMVLTRALAILAGLGILSSLYHGFRASDRGRKVLVAMMFAGSALAFLGYMKYNLTTYMPTARLVMPGLGFAAGLIVFGLMNMVPDRFRATVGQLMASLMLILNLGVLMLVILPAYDNPIAKQYVLDAHQNYSRVRNGNVGGDRKPGQTFQAQHPGLSRIDVFLVAGRRPQAQPIRLVLRESSLSGQVVASTEILKQPLIEAEYSAFVFPPVQDSEGRTFFFYLESDDWEVGDGAEIWYHPLDRYPGGQRYEGNIPVDGDLRFVALSLRSSTHVADEEAEL